MYLALIQLDNNNKYIDEETKSIKRTNSFVGTAQFVAPEILKRGAVHVGLVTEIFLERYFMCFFFVDLIYGH